MKVKELIVLLKTLPQESEIEIGYDSNLGTTRPTGKFEIKKYGDGYEAVKLMGDS